MSKSIGKILITNDYTRFRKLRGNRELRRNIGLDKSIKKSGILIPIEVNEHFEILDGQNRFELAKKMNKPIPYRILEGVGIEEVIDLNSTTKAWTIMNYVNKYCLDGNLEYIQLKKLTNQYKKIPVSSLASAGEGNLNLNARTTKNVREGHFSFYNYEAFCLFLKDYNLFLSRTGVKGGQYTFFAFFNLYTTEIFEFERLVNGIINKVQNVNSNTNIDVVVEIFLEAHNRGLKEESKLAIEYFISKKSKPVIKSSRNIILLNMKG
ncbi:ParB N-terminal domain-containing protein [Enterococcus faecium]|uniref:ParB N-terminal domain-containing protein n=1 Tax=Enterococcus faecium TaxID=1352 RepID=UPI001883D72B|nr:ParB N-terminal domain-containing protein [Enterococcus faecium]EGP5243165.1 chromosome partitioning protein ParB [Enterococcus faecium]MBE9892655.1 ParB N-terminal domain-containing protein [Enterococcus faecium]